MADVEKALNPAPQGILDLGDMPAPDVEIEIVLEGGPLELEVEEEEEDFTENLAEVLSDEELDSISGELLEDFEDDVNSRADWIQTYVDGLELLGLKVEDRTEPWEGACGVYHPLLSEALVKFQAETMMERLRQ